MNAGRELDALVAEKVMGITWDERRCPVCGWAIAPGLDQGCIPGNCSMRPRPQHRADEPAPYSTDIAAAWQVVQRMRALDYRATMQTWVNSADVIALFYKPEDTYNPDRHIGVTDDTAPLAICRAALRVLGVEL